MQVAAKFGHPANVAEARAIQERLRASLVLADRIGPIRRIAGVDVGFHRARNLLRASVVVMDFPDLVLRDAAVAEAPPVFPYVPGYLSFREVPVILEAFGALGTKPDLLMVDGHGIAHPRRLGIASHLGLVLDLPSIGVAKSRLCGTFEEPGASAGDVSALTDRGETIGVVLRSRVRANPLFISSGHRVSLKTAQRLVEQCLNRFRLPEPTRVADQMSKFPRR
jgi:deoxyribonuclease V